LAKAEQLPYLVSASHLPSIIGWPIIGWGCARRTEVSRNDDKCNTTFDTARLAYGVSTRLARIASNEVMKFQEWRFHQV
jgi:hypothetical protein